jgi:transcriptional repressor NrdR
VQIEALVDSVEDVLSREAGVEFDSIRLGALVMERLSPLDRVAYVRFASVYRNFQDAGEFQEFVDEMAAAQRREELRRNQVELPL